MTTMETPTVADWLVTFVMTLGPGMSRRVFVVTIPATDKRAALTGAHRLATAVCEASGGVWGLTTEFSAERVAS